MNIYQETQRILNEAVSLAALKNCRDAVRTVVSGQEFSYWDEDTVTGQRVKRWAMRFGTVRVCCNPPFELEVDGECVGENGTYKWLARFNTSRGNVATYTVEAV